MLSGITILGIFEVLTLSLRPVQPPRKLWVSAAKTASLFA